MIALAPRDPLYKKMMSNIEEVKGRDGVVIAVVTQGDTSVSAKADQTIEVQATSPLCCDVDRPRNLAKSVTVE